MVACEVFFLFGVVPFWVCIAWERSAGCLDIVYCVVCRVDETRWVGLRGTSGMIDVFLIAVNATISLGSLIEWEGDLRVLMMEKGSFD